jgi:Tol biopolymer transport system component
MIVRASNSTGRKMHRDNEENVGTIKRQVKTAKSWLICIGLTVCAVVAIVSIIQMRRGPGGRIVYVKGISAALMYTMDPDGNNAKRLTSPCIGDPVSPVWSPNGSQIAFGCRIADGTQNLCVIGTEGEEKWRSDCKYYTALIDPAQVPSEFCTGYIESVSWAPDGQRLAITCPYHRGEMICIITVGGEIDCWSVSVISGGNEDLNIHGEAKVSWSPTQDRLALSFQVQEDPTKKIYLTDPDGRNSIFLVEGRNPSWSPDGKRLAFFHRGLHIIDQDGSNLQSIYQSPTYPPEEPGEMTPGFVSRAAWSPDGHLLVFSGSLNPSGGSTGIYIANLKTKEIERITEQYDGQFSDPDWSH